MTYWYSPAARGFFLANLHASIPSDAVEITAEEHAALMAAQSAGMRIVPDEDGRPIAAPHAAPPAEVLAAAARAERDRLLAASDWTQIADAPLDAEGRAAWAAYRAALRAVPDQPGFPAGLDWPVAP